jgi:hypothetical protein
VVAAIERERGGGSAGIAVPFVVMDVGASVGIVAVLVVIRGVAVSIINN